MKSSLPPRRVPHRIPRHAPSPGRGSSSSPEPSGSRGRPPTRATPDASPYPPFNVPTDAMRKPHQRDLSPTSGALFPTANRRFRVRLATQNAFPTDLETISYAKAEMAVAFAEAPERLLRFKEERPCEIFFVKLVSDWMQLLRSMLTSFLQTVQEHRHIPSM